MVNFTSPPRSATGIPKAPPPGSIPQPEPDGLLRTETVPDWDNIGLFTAGIALGAILGASVALLFAPASGEDTRALIGRRVRRERTDDDVWDELAAELARAASDSEREEADELEAALKS
jgi:hypothetical protein